VRAAQLVEHHLDRVGEDRAADRDHFLGQAAREPLELRRDGKRDMQPVVADDALRLAQFVAEQADLLRVELRRAQREEQAVGDRHGATREDMFPLCSHRCESRASASAPVQPVETIATITD
jgi:hypothetical protein